MTRIFCRGRAPRTREVRSSNASGRGLRRIASGRRIRRPGRGDRRHHRWALEFPRSPEVKNQSIKTQRPTQTNRAERPTRESRQSWSRVAPRGSWGAPSPHHVDGRSRVATPRQPAPIRRKGQQTRPQQAVAELCACLCVSRDAGRIVIRRARHEARTKRSDVRLPSRSSDLGRVRTVITPFRYLVYLVLRLIPVVAAQPTAHPVRNFATSEPRHDERFEVARRRVETSARRPLMRRRP
jgi:hypothetical protein